jgi:4-amino-4-deoxy-L-arabinose transferase-like glycosyltransferase
MNRSENYPLLRPSGYYPPLVAVVTALAYFIFGKSITVAIMSNIIFVSVLVISIYKLGILIFNRNVGLLASFIILSFPIILNHSVIYYLDLPLTAFVSVSSYALMKSEFFRDTKFSILSGILFGLGMLTKWTYFFFMIGPVFYLVLTGFLSELRHEGEYERITNQKISINFLLFIITSLFIFGPYYFPILPDLLMETFRFSRGAIAHGPKNVLSFSSVLFYPAALWHSLISPFGFILFVLGTIRLLYSKSKQKTFLLVSMLVPYVIFTFIIQNKSPRYVMPWLPTISLIASFLIVKVNTVKLFDKSIKIGKYAVFVVLIVLAVIFFAENETMRTSFIEASREKWQTDELVHAIESDIEKSKNNLSGNLKLLYVGVIPDHRFINGQTIRYYFALRRIPVNVIKLTQYQHKSVEHFINKFDRYNYIVTKTSENSVISSFQEYVDDMHLYFYSQLQYFRILLTVKEDSATFFL